MTTKRKATTLQDKWDNRYHFLDSTNNQNMIECHVDCFKDVSKLLDDIPNDDES